MPDSQRERSEQSPLGIPTHLGGDALRDTIRPEELPAQRLPPGAPFEDIELRLQTLEKRLDNIYAHDQYGYDSFNRTAGDDLGVLDSGQSWSEISGDVDIVSSTARMGAVGTLSVAAFDLGPQERFEGMMRLNTVGATQTNVGLIFRGTGPNDYLLVQVVGSAVSGPNGEVRLRKRVAGVSSTLVAQQFGAALNASRDLFLWVVATGPVIMFGVTAFAPAPDFVRYEMFDVAADTYTTTLQSGRQAGLHISTASGTSDRISMFQFRSAAVTLTSIGYGQLPALRT